MIFLLLLIAYLAPLVVLFALGWAALPSGSSCPVCSHETVAIRSLWSRLSRYRAHLRWCVSCGWEGLARSARPPLDRSRWTIERIPEEADDAGRRD